MSNRPEVAPAVDVLADVLGSLDLRGWLHSRTEIVPPWRFDFMASHDSVFHIIGSGGGYLLAPGSHAGPLPISEGDVIVFPYGDAHAICDEPASSAVQEVALDYHASREHQVFPFEGDGSKSVMLCGSFRMEHHRHLSLLQSLPRLIHIPAAQGRLSPDFAGIVDLIAAESRSRRPGAEAVLRRLTEIFFIHIIRAWVERQPPEAGGWLRALEDPSISRALGLIHQAPGRPWNVTELAAAAGLSRSAFSARFTHIVGEPPMKYLTRWRMHRATRLLAGGHTIPIIAGRLGYDSEIAFRKAFKRQIGVPPGRYRTPPQADSR
ncbi:AraC family transcriptional regulator [Nonomuraea sp. NPDC050536]|uniref:AraC family transcriptional regulator n=1 Tax=Nonomuraea sp. NPDC050536 TaxID=3364366 RepID=UPI0037C68701